MTLTVEGLDHLVANVRDVEVSAAWYQRVLGMTREDTETGKGPVTAVKFGRQKINLRPITKSMAPWGRSFQFTAGIRTAV